MSENGGLAELADRWANEAIATSHISLSYNEVRALMVDLAGRLVDLLTAEPFHPEPAAAVGERLIAENFTGMHALDRTLRILGRDLLPSAGLTGETRMTDRLTELTGALAAGYVGALRERLFDEQEMIKKAVFRAREVSERERVATEARFRAVFASSSVGIAITDLRGQIQQVNPALSEILHYPQAELLTGNIGTLLEQAEVVKVRTALERVADGDLPRYTDDVNFVGGDGEPRWTRLSLALVRNAEGEADYTVAIVEDISDLRLLQINQRTHSLHDQLTGLPNRTLFTSTLNARLRGAGPEEAITLAFLDLDGFKIITDGLGHETGNDVLRRVATVLTKVFPEPDAYVARMGGDGFAVLATGRTGTFEFSERITEAMAEFAEPVYLPDGTGVAVSASVGIVQRRAAGVNSEDLVRAAELTTHRAKAGGKAQWVLYDEELNERDQAAFRLGAAIPGALETGEFVVSYQPLRRLTDRGLIGMRSVLHWNHPRRGALLPGEFLCMAEETGFIVPLGRWWLEQVCQQLDAWQREFGTTPLIGISMTDRMSREQDLIRMLRETLSSSGANPAKLRVGVPATAAIESSGEPLENLAALDDLGVAAVVTDYGGGGAGLVDLRALPLRAVTVAPGVVRAFGANGDDSPFARGIEYLAKLGADRGIDVVALGVDDADIAARLPALGVRHGAGTALGLPLSAADATALLADEWRPPASNGQPARTVH